MFHPEMQMIQIAAGNPVQWLQTEWTLASLSGKRSEGESNNQRGLPLRVGVAMMELS